MKRILIAEDDDGIRDALKIMLEMNGYEVITISEVNSPSQLIDRKPDLILLDIWLGGTDGKVVCSELKAHKDGKHIQVIMISANQNTEIIAQECGADGFILKPFDMDNLLSTIEKHTI